MKFKAAIFDMDGVITDTATVHACAWKSMFDAFLSDYAQSHHESFRPFTQEDYLNYVDGLNIIDGVKNFLSSRGIDIPLGKERDGSHKITLYGMANKKTKLFLHMVERKGVKPYKDAIAFIKSLKKHEIKIAVISASRSCQKILQMANIIDLFDVIVGGKEVKKLHLKGKPDPAIFLEAVRRLEVKPEESAGIEDAQAGIKAIQAGGFGLNIGVDRSGKCASKFKKSGAHMVIKNFKEVSYEKIVSYFIRLPVYAMQCFDDIKLQLNKKQVFICLDYDGTLTPIVDTPSLAIISSKMQTLLEEISQQCPVAIISGRQLTDIAARVGVEAIYYAGNHGLEISKPGIFAQTFEYGKEFINELNNIYEALMLKLSSVKGCIVENKIFSLSVHYRLISKSDMSLMEACVEKILVEYPEFKKRKGKKVFEILSPAEWDKGKTLWFILNQFIQKPSEDYLPIYIGDDLTDEDGFLALKKRGIGILVSEKLKRTRAKYRLKSVDEVYQFLLEIKKWVLAKPSYMPDGWALIYKNFDPHVEKLREALCVLANGYMGVRGAAEESSADHIHYPGVYFAGCYNFLESKVEDKILISEDLVNMPNPLSLTFKLPDSEVRWFNLTQFDILDYQQQLDFYGGVLKRLIRFKDKRGRITRFESLRLVSMENPHVVGIKINLWAENWEGKMTIKSGLSGNVINDGVARYRGLNASHLVLIASGANDGNLYLHMRTTGSKIEIAEVAKHVFTLNDEPLILKGKLEKDRASIYWCEEVDLKEKNKLSIEKLIYLMTSKDRPIKEALQDVLLMSKDEKYFGECLRAHQEAWKAWWKYCDIFIEKNAKLQQLIRLHIFHLLQICSKNTIDLDVGVPARGLHGEAYRGHIFWDELFIFPFYIFSFPEIARSLLLYRYRRLNAARRLARQAGYKGAMYPWQSGSNGEEVSQSLHLNPISHAWTPDYSCYQRHVNAAIVYNIWQYYCATNDKQFMTAYGAEIILEIAKFWSSIAIYNPAAQRYEIENVMGPDEYHEKYPHSDKPGVKNNAYTNIMAVWCIEKALYIVKTCLPPLQCQELIARLGITKLQIERWKDMTTKMKVPFQGNHIISQFEGYELLQELDWDDYRKKYGNIERLDRILKAEGDSPDRYQVSKQADVLMLFYLFSREELSAIFHKLSYPFDEEILKKNIAYYTKCTSHGSTLSKLVFASIYYCFDKETAYTYYQDVLSYDVREAKDSTTQEGIHLGAMGGGIWFIYQRFAGLHIRNRRLNFHPALPKSVNSVKFQLFYRGKWFVVHISRHKFSISRKRDGLRSKTTVSIKGKTYQLSPNEMLEVDC